jgi:hypothetical protein
MLRFILLSILVFPVFAQDRIGTIQVRVSTDRSDWRYEPGRPVHFRIVAVQDGHALSGIKVTYRIGAEMIPPKIDQTATLTEDGLSVDGGTMNEPGFLRCIATVEQKGKPTADSQPPPFARNHQTYSGGPAGFVNLGFRAALTKLPVDAKITPLPEYVTPWPILPGQSAERRHGRRARVSTVFYEPKAPGKYPALLKRPGVYALIGVLRDGGRGVYPAGGDSRHPVTMEQSVCFAGALANYNTFGLDNRDRYYYRRVFCGCVRVTTF